MKYNRPISLTEKEQTVNEVTLQELYDNASKTEQQIINLSMTAVKFSSNDIKAAAQSLRSQAHDLTTLIGTAMSESGLPPTQNPEEIETDKQQLDAPPAADEMIEADQMMGDIPGPSSSLNEAFVMMYTNVDGDTAKKVINELGDKRVSSMMHEYFTRAKGVDLSEAYSMKDPGGTNFHNFKSAVSMKLKESNESVLGKFAVRVHNSKDAVECDGVMNEMFDYADNNAIKIKTV